MRDIEHRRTLEAIQHSRVYNLLSAAVGPGNKCVVSFLVEVRNDDCSMDQDLPARRFVKQDQMALLKQCSHDIEDLLLSVGKKIFNDKRVETLSLVEPVV